MFMPLASAEEGTAFQGSSFSSLAVVQCNSKIGRLVIMKSVLDLPVLRLRQLQSFVTPYHAKHGRCNIGH